MHPVSLPKCLHVRVLGYALGRFEAASPRQICCNTLQHPTTHRNTPRNTATQCRMLQLLFATPTLAALILSSCICDCKTLQHAATRCNALLHTATHRHTLQHALTASSRNDIHRCTEAGGRPRGPFEPRDSPAAAGGKVARQAIPQLNLAWISLTYTRCRRKRQHQLQQLIWVLKLVHAQ